MAQARKILIVDDDDDLRELLIEQFSLDEDFLPCEAENAEKALAAIRSDPPDLVVMDIGLPDMNGRDAVSLMRQRGYKNPIILITGYGSDEDTILGLEAGANDYVNKPFRFAVLLARIRAHLRSHDDSLDALFQIGNYQFNPGAKNLVSEAGDRMRLTEKEVAILRFLYRARSQVVDRDTLLREVWGYSSAVTTHTLETHIYRLRQKIESDPAHAQLLVTEAGGYRLIP